MHYRRRLLLVAVLGLLHGGAPGRGDEPREQPQGGLIGGVGLYLMKPHFVGNTAYTVERENQNPPRGTPTFHYVESVDIDHHFEAAPLVWLGYVGQCGMGGRARYWHFQSGTGQDIAFPASTGDTLVTVLSATPLGLQGFGDTLSQPKDKGPGVPEPTAVSVTSLLDLHVVDLESLHQVTLGGWDCLISGGVRIARIKQGYNFYDLQPTTNPLVFRALISDHTFQGAGPVVACEARRSVCDCGLAVFGSARAAMLFGRARQSAVFGGTILRNDDANPQHATEQRDRGLAVFEAEIGVEYGREVGGMWMFGQVAVVGQDWLGAGNATRSGYNTFREGAPIGGVADDSDLALFGLSFRVGVNY